GEVATPTTVDIGEGEIRIEATSVSDATSLAIGGAFGVASISGLVSEATIGAITRAYIGEGPTVHAGEVDVIADSTDDAKSDVFAVGAGFITGQGVLAEANVLSVVSAFIGTPALTTGGT